MKKSKCLSKFGCIFIVFVFCLILSVVLPSLANYRNESPTNISTTWDGMVATSYRSGTGIITDPYIISNGAELAYFSSMLSTQNYANTYFSLNSNIVLNNGVFNYNDTDGVTYMLNNTLYYVKPYTNELYDNSLFNGGSVGTINIFESLENFEGEFIGNSHTIYGLYITSEIDRELALFTNLHGNINDLYVSNALVYGGNVTGGIVSYANDASLNSVLYNGYVVSNSLPATDVVNVEILSQSIDLDNSTTEEMLEFVPPLKDNVVSTSLSGNCVITGDGIVAINSIPINGEFSIDLTPDLVSSIPVLYKATGNVNFSLTDLQYIVTYNHSVAGGIIAEGNNVTLNKVINKGDIYGNLNSGGIVGNVTNGSQIRNTYNTGLVKGSNIRGGIVASIIGNSSQVTISNSYNTSTIDSSGGGLIGSINGSEAITLSSIFDASSSIYAIGMVLDSTVNINNAYYTNNTPIGVGSVTGEFTLSNNDELKDKTFVINNLMYDEFIDNENLIENPADVWVFNDQNYPLLFIDDILEPMVIINTGTQLWNSFHSELNNIRFDTDVLFSIEGIDNLRPIKDVYYITSNVPLTYDEVIEINDWHNYTGITQITTEGVWIIYAKVVDYNDNVIYINSDLLIYDSSLPIIDINASSGESWHQYSENLNYLYINDAIDITVSANDSLSGVSSVEYYLTDEIMTEEELNLLSNNDWTIYNTYFTLSNQRKYIVYVRIIDNYDFVTYANSDCIVYNGYSLNSINIGRNNSSLISNIYVTSNSTLTFNYTYIDDIGYDENYQHNLVSNILLPINTKLTLIDNITKKVYTYVIDSSDDLYGFDTSCDGKVECTKRATYPFTLFDEVGKGTMKVSFEEISTVIVNENYTVVLDLSNTNLQKDYKNIMLYMELEKGEERRMTLQDTLKTFNVYSNKGALLEITTSYDSQIIYNSDNTYQIPIVAGLNYNYQDGNMIYDTSYEDQILGLAVRLVDENDNIVSKDKLKNITFKIGDVRYSPNDDGITRINIGNGVNSFDSNLTVITSLDNITLAGGNYYLKIASYVAYDGAYSLTTSNEIIILVLVSNDGNVEYSFDVLMDDADRIIDKKNATATFNLGIIEKVGLSDPIIRVSLYEKDELTAYNQDYSLVDLGNYVSDTLSMIDNSIYYAVINPITYDGTDLTINEFALNFITSNLENTSYKLVFELYTGERRIGMIEKKFIVKGVGA